MFRRVACASPWLALLIACGGATQEDPDASLGLEDAGPPASACLAREDTYMTGLEKAGGDLTVRIVAADPAPPRRGINTWRVQIIDARGSSVAQAALKVTPFMPDHGHGTSVTPKVTREDDGNYQIDDVYLYMAGLWETTIEVTRPGDPIPVPVVFRFCIEG